MSNGQGRAMRLYCFAPAGGSAHLYSGWQAEFQHRAEIIPIELPGRGARMLESPVNSWVDLINEVAGRIQPEDQPYAFFGHSFGALLAFELTHWLRDAGKPLPAMLFLSGCEAPDTRVSRARTGDQPLSDAWLLGEIHKYSGTPIAALQSPELVELLLPAFRADFELSRQYQWCQRDTLPMPFCILAGREDPFTSPSRLTLWNIETDAEFNLHWFPGGHFFVESSRTAVMQRVSSELAQLQTAIA